MAGTPETILAPMIFPPFSGAAEWLNTQYWATVQAWPASPYLVAAIGVTTFYLLLVRVLRYRNLSQIRQLARPYRADLDDMPYNVAHEIIKITLGLESPVPYHISQQRALLKSYMVHDGDGGTQLLVDTRQLSDPKVAGRRLEDTGVLLGNLLLHRVDSERGSKAIARVNWLHRRYAHIITNTGMIFTLALFVLEACDYMDQWSWRRMDPAEQHALFVVWREIGAHMGIQNCPQTLQALRQWQDNFVATRTGESESGKKLAAVGMGVFLQRLPERAQPFLANLMLHSMTPRERKVLGLDDPTPAWDRFLTRFLSFRAWIVRNAFLPRLRSAAQLGEQVDGRVQRPQWLYEPWYVADTWYSKLLRTLGVAPKLQPGPSWQSEGYRPEAVGPARYEKLGHAEVLNEARKIRGDHVEGTCPFGFGGRME